MFASAEELLGRLPEASIEALLQHFDAKDIDSLPLPTLEVYAERLDWLQRARPAQLPPLGTDWFVWMLMAGRGSGKTRSGAEHIWWPASQQPQRIAVVGPTLADVRKTCFEGESGLEAVIPKSIVKGYNRSQCEMWIETVTGEESYFVGYSSEEPERLRGPQHHHAWCDELAAWRYIQETWDMLMFGLRLGDRPTVVATTTPKPVGLVRALLKDPRTRLSRESTFANSANLPPTILQILRDKYEGTRLGRQELHAEVLDDNPYALWSMAMLDKSRVALKDKPDLQKSYVSVDPPVTSGDDADECGIVAGGIARLDGKVHGYVTHDWSVQGLSPHGWASRAVSLYHQTDADAIVAEVNQGGDMVESVIHGVDSRVPVIKVRATRGKVVRAEPVALLYEQGRVHHVGSLPMLEDQMCDFTSDFDKDVMGYSPDRVDAAVWLLTQCMLTGAAGYGMLDAI